MEDWFVGRSNLIADFDRSTEEARGGRLSFTAIVGEAGLGKSVLMDMLADRAVAAGAVVCRARAYEGAELPSLQVFSDWVRELIVAGRELQGEQCRIIETDEAVGLALLAPSYCRQEVVDRALSLPYREQQAAVAGFCKRYVAALTSAPAARAGTPRPLAVLIDDLHRCDEQSLDALHRFIVSNRSAPAVVVATMRPQDDRNSVELDTFLESTVSERIGHVSRLTPFTLEDISSHLSRRAAGHDSWSAKRLLAESGGHPLVMRWLLEEGTGSVTYFVKSRTGILSPAASESLRALALFGLDFDARLAAAIYRELERGTSVVESDSGSIVEVLVEKGLVIGRSSGYYAIIHDLVRREIVGGLDAGMKSRLHARLGRILAKGDFLEPNVRDLTIGTHLLQSSEEIDLRAGLQFLMTAARNAERRGAWSDALAIWRRAEAAPASITDELTRADIAFGVGRAIMFKPVAYPEYYEAMPKLHQAVEVYLNARAIDRIAEAALINGSINYLGWGEHFRQALEFVPEDHPKRPIIEYRWGSMLVSLGLTGVQQLDEGERVLRRALERCRIGGARWLEAYILPELAEACYSRGDLESARDLCEKAAVHPAAAADPWLGFRPAITHARVLWRLGRVEQAEAIARKLVDFIAGSRGLDANIHGGTQAALARLALARGDWKTAAKDVGSETIFNLRPIITAHYLTGGIAEGDRYLDRLIPGIRNDQTSWALVAAFCTALVGIRCRVCPDGKYLEEARRWAAQSIEGLEELDALSRFMLVRIRIGQIRIGFETADEELLRRGSTGLEQLWPDPSHTQSNHLAEHTLFRAKALAASGLGKKAEAVRLFETALTWCEHYRDLPVRAWTYADLSFVYHDLEMPREAERFAERALAEARRLGMKPLEERLLHGPTTVDRFRHLTAREREVLELVASGFANKEIAGKLGISSYTAANHVRHIMEKLGCSNRAEAAAVARETVANS